MKKTSTWIFLAILSIYVILAFTLPTDPRVLQDKNLTQVEARLLNVTIVLPFTLIYIVALYGYRHVKDYADKIRDAKEGPYFGNIALGLMALTFNLPISSLLSTLKSYSRHQMPDLTPIITIFQNYVTLALAFAGLYFIAKGSQGLYRTLKPRGKTSNSQSFYGLAGTVALTSVYTWLVVAQGYATPGTAPYFLPTWLLIITFVIPYVFAWCMGIWAALCLRRYYTAVKGTIYKEALNNLYKGVAGIVVVSIFLQSLTSVPGLVNRLDLTPLLIVVYVLIATYAIGYGLVANGAKKLKLIEIA